MKSKLLLIISAVTLFSFPNVSFGQSIDLGTASGYVLFSTVGAVTHTGISQITGNVGTNSGGSTNFGNVNGVMNDQNGASAQCAADVLSAYTQLDDAIPTMFISSALGGDTLTFGVYSITGGATLNADLTLDAQGNPNAVFIFQLDAPLSTSADSRIVLLDEAQACNVFWKVEGLVSMASGTSMKGTVIANNSAIDMSTGVTLEGRALAIAGAVTVDGVLAYVPVGCGSAVLTGPNAPVLGSAECFTIFSSDGDLTNAGLTYVTGDVGTNVGLTTGFSTLTVTGTVHSIPDIATAACAADLLVVSAYLDSLPYDIELLYPVQFGGNLVLTPHTYIMNGAVTLTDTLYLNARGNADAVFVIQTYGAFSTSTHSRVLLTGGTQAKNVYWKMSGGAVSINDSSVFNGTIICEIGAIDLTIGVELNGRALTTEGIYTTAAITAEMPPGCLATGVPALPANSNDAIAINPNPFNTFATILVNDALHNNHLELRMYNVLGQQVINTILADQLTTLETMNLPSGIYFFELICNNKTIQSGKLVSLQ